jgi:hypothetical protein
MMTKLYLLIFLAGLGVTLLIGRRFEIVLITAIAGFALTISILFESEKRREDNDNIYKKNL